MGGAFFHPDPGLGFPPGTPDTIPTSMSTSALLHMVSGSLAFLALIGACFVLARPFAAARKRSLALALGTPGVIFAAGLVESLAGGPVGSLVLFVTASIAFVATGIAAAQLRAELTI